MFSLLKQKVSMSRINLKNDNAINIFNEMEFKQILKHERLRTDREGSTFSLVLFKVEEDSYYEKKLINRLCDNVRIIDILGWFNKTCIGVILPLTDYENSLKFCFQLPINQFFPRYTVYTYPNHWKNINNKKIHEINILNLIQNNNYGQYKNILENQNILSNIKIDITSVFVNKIPLWKKTFDIFFSFFGLLLLSPLFLLIGIYIKIVSPGPIIFKQKRVGYKNKLFNFYKFRTMHINNNEQCHQSYISQIISSNKPMIKLDKKDDQRIIKGGRILRKTCIDELPQLFNVLKGDMSLIGPRPCLSYEEKKYLQWHKNRFYVLPGMTGLWQVSGKNKLSFNQMIRLDISYIKNISLSLDLKILLLTIPTVIGLIFENKITKSNISNNAA